MKITAKSRMKRSLSLAGVGALMLSGLAVGGVAVAETASAQPNTCHTVVVQKKLPWYQCVNLRPGTLLPAACYGDVTKVVCSQ